MTMPDDTAALSDEERLALLAILPGVLKPTLEAFPFHYVTLNDGERRGYQLALCSRGVMCCGHVTVIRRREFTEAGAQWSARPYILWPSAKGPRPPYAVENFMHVLTIAQRIGGQIPVTDE